MAATALAPDFLPVNRCSAPAIVDRIREADPTGRVWHAAYATLIRVAVEVADPHTGAVVDSRARLAEILDLNRKTIGAHLELLERAGLVEPDSRGWVIVVFGELQGRRARVDQPQRPVDKSPEAVDRSGRVGGSGVRSVPRQVGTGRTSVSAQYPADQGKRAPKKLEAREPLRTLQPSEVAETITPIAQRREGSTQQPDRPPWTRLHPRLAEVRSRLDPASAQRLDDDWLDFGAWQRLRRAVAAYAELSRGAGDKLVDELSDGGYSTCSGNAWAAVWSGRLRPLLAAAGLDPDRPATAPPRDQPTAAEALEVPSTATVDQLRDELLRLPPGLLADLESRASARGGGRLPARLDDRVRAVHAELVRARSDDRSPARPRAP